MNGRRGLGEMVTVFVLAAALAACGGDEGNEDSGGAGGEASPSLLYVQQAEQGTFVPAGGGDTRSHTLTLQGVPPRTVYFSDRPDRVAGTVANRDFARLETLFAADDPPNAAIVVSEPRSDDQDVAIVELSAPSYDESTGTFSYTAVIVDEVPEGLSHWEPDQDPSLPATLGPVSLFIDSSEETECPGQVSWDNGTVVVTATDDGTKQPLAGAEVQLFGTSDHSSPDYSGTTDASGQLTLSVIPSDALIQDHWATVVTLSGYATLEQQVQVCPDQTVQVSADLTTG
jgi:hypothetical protein